MRDDFADRLVHVAAMATDGTESVHEGAAATVVAILRELDRAWQPIDVALAELADEIEEQE